MSTRSSDRSRRRFLKEAATAGAALAAARPLGRLAFGQAPPFVSSDRPVLAQGIQIGDVLADSAMIWSRSDREARMVVEWATTPSFHNVTRVMGPSALAVTG